MSNAKRTNSPTNETMPWQALSAWNVGPSDAGHQMVKASCAYLEGVAALNSEFAKFVATRFGHDAALSRELGRCEDPSAAMELQQHWVSETTAEYAKESQRLIEMGIKLVTDTAASMQAAVPTKGSGATS